MSIRSQRTGRHEDDFPAAFATGNATVRGAMEHAQEIIVETPEAFGQTTSRVVSILLDVIRQQQTTDSAVDLDEAVGD